MNEDSNNNSESIKNSRKKLIIASLSLSSILFIVFIITIAVTLSYPNTYVKRLYDRSLKSVVELKAYTKDVGESFGSAVLLKKNGTLGTNAHVVTYSKLGEQKPFDEISIRFANSDDYIPVSLVKYDTSKDLAVLKIKKNNKGVPIKVANLKRAKSGDEVFAVGNLSNYGIGITRGYISVPKINIVVEGNKKEVIQCDITIVSGSSGGALLDKKGKLLGITTFRIKDNLGNVIHGIGYIIPVNKVLEYIN